MKVFATLGNRWVVIVALTIIGLGLGAAYSLLTPQKYTSTVRTYTAAGTSDMLEAYQGNQAAQASIQSFAVLATDPAVAQTAIDKAGVNISVADFLKEISVSVPPMTVVLDISVTDGSPQNAQRLSQALAETMVGLVDKLQQPAGGGPGALHLVVVDPNTQGAVRQQLMNPLYLGLGGGIGLLLGVLAALLLDRRAGRRPEGGADESVTDDLGGQPLGSDTADAAQHNGQHVDLPGGTDARSTSELDRV